jgi:hypothetical protein
MAMLQKRFRFTGLGLVSALYPVFVIAAQDASFTWRTSANYRTPRATLPLTETQRKQDDFARDAQHATQAKRYRDAVQAYYQGLAIMRGLEWTPVYEVASSLEGRVDRPIGEPGKQMTVTLKPPYASRPAAETKMMSQSRRMVEQARSFASTLSMSRCPAEVMRA